MAPLFISAIAELLTTLTEAILCCGAMLFVLTASHFGDMR